jgi:hypothetical protein
VRGIDQVCSVGTEQKGHLQAARHSITRVPFESEKILRAWEMQGG